jgi:hypothetical protein
MSVRRFNSMTQSHDLTSAVDPGLAGLAMIERGQMSCFA